MPESLGIRLLTHLTTNQSGPWNEGLLGGIEEWLHLSLTSQLNALSGQHHAAASPSAIASDTHWTGGGMGFRTGLMFWGKTLAPARIQTLDHPAHTSITILTALLPPYKKMKLQKFIINFLLVKLRFTKMKLSLCMPWRHTCESGV